MSTQQDIYAAGSENRPPMLNKDNYLPWSSHLLRYTKRKPNGNLIYNSIMHGPYIILMGLPEDIYATVDSCETTQEIWLRVQQMMKGFNIRIQDKKAKFFNEWERFTSTDGELIESYYHRFLKLMNDFKIQKQSQVPKQPTTRMETTCGGNGRNQNEYDAVQNTRNQVVQNAVQNSGIQNVRNQNGLIVVLGIAYQNVNQNGNGNVVVARAEGNGNGNNENQVRCYNCRGIGHLARNCIVRPRRRDAAYLQTRLLITQKEEIRIQLQAEEFDLMAATGDLDEIKEVNANCILMANLQQASISERGDGVAIIKRRRQDLHRDGVRDLAMASGRGRLKEDLESSTWRRRHDFKATPPFSSTTMGDANHVRTLGDYSKPSHEGYRNTIELLVGNNVVPLRSDTIWLVQNGCSFHGLQSEDPNQHLKDFLKLVDSLDLDGENKERTRLRLFQFSLRDQASNWLERFPVGSITTWEDLTTRLLA
ncbi:retrovirus-related pol polyprotein from transposon TNT 1-94 [Tanacetum coccineum]